MHFRDSERETVDGGPCDGILPPSLKASLVSAADPDVSLDMPNLEPTKMSHKVIDLTMQAGPEEKE